MDERVICNYEELFLVMENSFLFVEMFNRLWVIRCLGDLCDVTS